MAAPHVAAAAALLYRQGITNPVAIQRALEQTAEDLGAAGRDDQFGHGLIRPAEALQRPRLQPLADGHPTGGLTARGAAPS